MGVSGLASVGGTIFSAPVDRRIDVLIVRPVRPLSTTHRGCE
jgi:hypothetical protein